MAFGQLRMDQPAGQLTDNRSPQQFERHADFLAARLSTSAISWLPHADHPHSDADVLAAHESD